MMSRLERAARQEKYDTAVGETVRASFVALLKEGGAGVPVFAAKVLHGEYGANAARTAWRELERGMAAATGPMGALRMSFGAYCMAHGRLEILREVVKRGAPATVSAEMRPADESQWLDLLCTTSKEREHPAFEGFDATTGLVGVAAANACDFPEHCLEAMELAWDVNPHHPGFDELTEEASEGGAFVRSFLMNKGIEMAATQSPSQTTAPSRARSKKSV